jgi:hypothetical protein
MTASCDDLSSTAVANSCKAVKLEEQKRYGSRKNHKLIDIPIPKLGMGTIPA